MEYENFTFVEALKFLADRAGVELPQMEYSKEAKEQADLKNTLLEINKQAAKFYYYQLHTERGKQGYDYLKGRGLSDDTIRKFGLGYSDKYGSLLYRFLKEKGYDDEILRQSGLFLADEVHGMQDKFWNRVIYPIMDANSRVIGFGGRVMGDGKPKYLNSPETKIFDKSRQPIWAEPGALFAEKESDHLRGLYGRHLHAPGGFQQRGGISWNGAHLAAGGAHEAVHRRGPCNLRQR